MFHYLKVKDICNKIMKTLFFTYISEIEIYIGCPRNTFYKAHNIGSILPSKWVKELLELNEKGCNYKKKYDLYKPKKIKNTVNNTKGIVSTKELLKKLNKSVSS